MSSVIGTWQPGTFYQPGDVVIRNAQGVLTQVFPDNPDFEAGDTGWTKGTGWTIGVGDSFEGTQSAAYAGAGGSLLLHATENGNAFTTSDGVNFAQTGAGYGTPPKAVAANDSVFVIIRKSGGDEVRTSVDGVTMVSRTPSWSGVTLGEAFYMPLVGLFIIGEVADATYHTSPDGITWTSREMPGTYDPVDTLHDFWNDGTTTYTMTDGGDVFSTLDGISWTRLTTSVNAVHNVIYDGSKAILLGSGLTYRLYFSTDMITWTRQNAAETSLNAALSGPGTTPGRIAFGNGVYVVNQDFNSGTPNPVATTDKTATSADALTWTAQNAFSGRALAFSAALQEFVTNTGGISNADFSLNRSTNGATWTQHLIAAQTVNCFTQPAELILTDPVNLLVNDNDVAVLPGQTVRARAMFKTTAYANARIGLQWKDSGASIISTDYSAAAVSGASTGWREASVEANAPTDAATCTVVLNGQGLGSFRADNVIWEYVSQADVCTFTFEATQAAAAYSDTFEPVWPTVLGGTVADGGVTWTARAANCVTYEAKPILISGPTEPTFPLEVDAGVPDNTINWIADDQRIKDEKCPNTKEVAIASSKVFAANEDIVSFSATINPLDWSTADDAGFIPFGLNTYGSQPITALGLYRSNLVVFNSKAFQMWQVDEDPTNFAILDAVPIGCPFYKSLQPVSNDLVFLTEAGIRSMGIAGASTNLQAGQFGKQIDPLVLAAIKGGEVPNGLYFPGAGQYWLFFGEEAFVLTMNGGKGDMSWSRYVFPSAIDDWTILGQDLILRSGEKIWRIDEDVLVDDSGGADVEFVGEIWWPYLDLGRLGGTKMLIGFDTVCTGEYSVVFGYNQNDDSHVTTSYTVTAGDNLYGDIIPMPISAPSIQMRLTFTGNTAWEWNASTLYIEDNRLTS